jgi:hypothetical protein
MVIELGVISTALMGRWHTASVVALAPFHTRFHPCHFTPDFTHALCLAKLDQPVPSRLFSESPASWSVRATDCARTQLTDVFDGGLGVPNHTFVLGIQANATSNPG